MPPKAAKLVGAANPLSAFETTYLDQAKLLMRAIEEGSAKLIAAYPEVT